jgi:hypothetical protein
MSNPESESPAPAPATGSCRAQTCRTSLSGISGSAARRKLEGTETPRPGLRRAPWHASVRREQQAHWQMPARASAALSASSLVRVAASSFFFWPVASIFIDQAQLKTAHGPTTPQGRPQAGSAAGSIGRWRCTELQLSTQPLKSLKHAAGIASWLCGHWSPVIRPTTLVGASSS